MSKSSREKAQQEFELWLPGELEYSARKAGYDKKVERARLPLDDPQSINGFLGQEWFDFQRLRGEGHHHVDFHGKSAQLQLAKFTAGLFDKAAVAQWLLNGGDATQEAILKAAHDTSEALIEETPWEYDYRFINSRGMLAQPYDKSLFGNLVPQIMTKIVSITEETDPDMYEERCLELFSSAVFLGCAALDAYTAYAAEDLAPDELVLPPSELAV